MSGLVTRRAALRGTAATTIGLAVAACSPAKGHAATLHPDDARLIELAAAAEALERACDAHLAAHRDHVTDESEEGFIRLCRGWGELEEEIAATPAATVAGVVAKARASQVTTMRGFDNCLFALSLADDVWRLFGGGVA